MARSAFFLGRPPLQRALLCVCVAIGWPFGAVMQTAAKLRKLPASQHPDGLWGWVRRAAHMLAVALLHNIPPNEYVMYRLHEPARRGRAADYFYRTDHGVLMLLNRWRGVDDRDVQDKARFAQICLRHELPCIATLAAFRDGRQIEPDDRPFVPTAHCLWVKDLAGSRGSGAQRWRRDAGCYRDDRGRALGAADLVAYLRRRDCIVQPYVSHHPALDVLSDGPLIDFRIVTAMKCDGEVEILTNFAALPWTNDRNRRRYILGLVDSSSERIVSAAIDLFEPAIRHPTTGERIADVVIPYWKDCLDLVRRAHQLAFSRFVFLGWDVAVTAQGPVLVETNAAWDATGHQLLSGVALGRTTFARTAAEYLRQM